MSEKNKDDQIRNLTTKISTLEQSVKDSDKRSQDLIQLAREIALAAVQHVRRVETESAELYALLEEIEEVHLKAYESKIASLESELQIYRQKEKGLKSDNADITEFHKQKITELEEKVSKYEKILFDPDVGDDDFRPTDAQSISTNDSNSLKRQSSFKFKRGSAFGTPSETNIPVVKEGYLLKKSPAMFRGWQRRYFVLTEDGKVSWYEKEQDFRKKKLERGYVLLFDIPNNAIEENIVKNKEYLKVTISGKSYDLDCGTVESAKDWWIALVSVCRR